ncbi:MAG: hypothetical protein HFACDABA_02206 [Anaerolineales bacterium]|nr:hypothetical protein [Anaerolineales bacterium]
MKHASVFLALLILLAMPHPAGAQSGTEFAEVQVISRFGETIQFNVRIQSSVPLQSATVTFREGADGGQTRPLAIETDGRAAYTYDARLNALKPFARIVFWFTATLTDGTVTESGRYNFAYEDNRFTWQTRSEGMIRVHWIEGDAQFGAAVLDSARRGAQSAGALFPVDLSAPIDVWVYPNAETLQSALLLGGRDWVAGHASPDMGVALVSVAPGIEQGIQLERQTPHELTHVLLFRRVGAHYTRLPLWLREGIASLTELYPNPDYDFALAQAAASNSIPPLADLCDSFPPDAAGAFLAYAASRSFTQFLVDNYGASGLNSLALAYADGLDCEQGARQALGLSLSQLEARWRESTLGENRSRVIAANLFPYLLLLILMLIVPVWGAAERILERRRHGR